MQMPEERSVESNISAESGRRLVAVAISHPVIHNSMLREGSRTNVVCTRGIPQDAEFISSFFDERSLTSYLIYHHQDFQSVPDGCEIPTMNVEFENQSGGS